MSPLPLPLLLPLLLSLPLPLPLPMGQKDTAARFANEQDKLAKRKVSRLNLAFRLPKWKTFFVLKC